MAIFKSNNAVPNRINASEAGAEAGAGANTTDASSSVAIEDEKADADAPSHGSSTDSPPRSPEGEKGLQPERGRAKIAIIMFALAMAVFLAAIDVTIITTALPSIAEYFHSASGYTWIGSAYLLANAASTPIWGKTSDIFGRKNVLLVANIVFFIGSLLAAVSVSIGMLIVARAIQGLGGGGLVVLVNICVGDLFSPRRRGAYYGIIGGVWAIASSLGPIVGGAFTEKVTWRWCFYINLPLDGLAFFIILFFLDLETPKTPFLAGIKAIDWIGCLLIVGGTLMLLLGLEFGGATYAWNSSTTICLIVFGVVTAIIFGLYEWKLAKYPIMPTRIFQYRSNLASLAVCFLHAFVFIASAYYLPLYFQAVLMASPIMSGVYILPMSLALALSSIATGIFIRKTGLYLPPIFFGFFCMTLGYGLFINLDAHSSWAKIILYQLVGGLGIGPNFQAPLIALQSCIAPRDIATATSTFGFVRNIATSMSVVIGGVIFQNQMIKKAGLLAASLGPQAAQQLGGGNAGANVQVVDALPPAPREVARMAFASSLSTMWIVYTAFAAVGLLTAFLIGKQTLSRDHQETATGLAAEEKNRQQNIAERAERKGLKSSDGPVKGKEEV